MSLEKESRLLARVLMLGGEERVALLRAVYPTLVEGEEAEAFKDTYLEWLSDRVEERYEHRDEGTPGRVPVLYARVIEAMRRFGFVIRDDEGSMELTLLSYELAVPWMEAGLSEPIKSAQTALSRMLADLDEVTMEADRRTGYGAVLRETWDF